jgi:hypothetical protein
MVSKTRKRPSVVGVFDTKEQAQHAIEEVRRAGFKDNQISLVMHHGAKGDIEITDLDAAKAAYVTGDSKARKGAGLGAVAGGLGLGALALTVGLIPGVGPVLSLGVLAPAFFGVGAAVGAVGGGIVGALIGLDFPEEEARYYEKELKAGHVLVGVQALERAGEARTILDGCGGAHAHAQAGATADAMAGATAGAAGAPATDTGTAAITGTPIGTASPVPPPPVPPAGGTGEIPPV